jgi:hypothetical protein
MKIELNTKGLRKALPFLEKLSEDVYDGGVNMRIGRDGQLRMDAKNPIALMEIASGYGIEIVYAGKDKHNDYCYDIIAEAGPAPEVSPVPTGAGSEPPGDVSRPDPAQEAKDEADRAKKQREELLKAFNEKLEAAQKPHMKNVGDAILKMFQNMELDTDELRDIPPMQLNI